jgi:hypothetical protein
LQFTDVLPHGMRLLEPAVDRKWALEFAASEPGHSKDITGSLRIPAGPIADTNAVVTDHFPYLRQDVRVPVFVVYGDYDTVVNDVSAEDFLSHFTASPLKWTPELKHHFRGPVLTPPISPVLSVPCEREMRCSAELVRSTARSRARRSDTWTRQGCFELHSHLDHARFHTPSNTNALQRAASDHWDP